MESLWGTRLAYDCALSQTVNRLRRGLEAFDATFDHIQTVWGFGYRLVLSEHTRSKRPTEDPLLVDPAFRRYQLAMFKQKDPSRIVDSIGVLHEVLALTPSFAPALIGLARAYVNAGVCSLIDPGTAYYEAKAAIAKAIALDSNNAEAFTVLSSLALLFDANLAGARDAAEQAMALSPNSPRAREAMAWQLLARGDHSAAFSEAYQALETSPSDANLTALLGIALYIAHRYDEACFFLADSVRFSPGYSIALFYYACANYMSHRYDEALAIIDRMPERELPSQVLALRGCIATLQGDHDMRKRYEADLAALPFPSDIFMAAMHVASGNLDAAASSLGEALKTREPALFVASIDPLFAPLQASHPDLVAKIRKGRQASCDRCSSPLALEERTLHTLRLCAGCSSL